jgi:hypothetical protein
MYRNQPPSSDKPDQCYFSACRDPETIPAIGTYNAIFGLDETVAMVLCDHHAAVLQDVVVLVTTP